MKLVFITLLAMVAMAKSQACVPNSQYKMDCNTCFCSPEGKPAGCTIMLCPPKLDDLPHLRETRSVEESERTCEPGSTYSYYCNTCTCMEDGKTAACTLMGCDPRVWNRDGTLKNPGKLA